MLQSASVFARLTEYLPLFSAVHFMRIVAILVIAVVAYRIVLAGTSKLKLLASMETDAARKLQREQRAETLRSILNNMARVVLVVTSLAMLFSEAGIDVTPILAGAGVVGIAIGFGAQSLVKDYFSGFFVVFENQFGIGDQVTLGGHSGTVERMTLRVTVLRDLDGGLHVVPNGKIDAVTVHSREWARANVDFTVSYSEDLSRVFEAAGGVSREFARENSDVVIDEPEVLGVDSLGPHGATIRVAVKTTPGKQQGAARELRRRLKAALDREHIRLATVEDPAARPSTQDRQ